MAILDPVEHKHARLPDPPASRDYRLPALPRPPAGRRFRSRGLSLPGAVLIALESLGRNRTRSFLATLGVIIGVGCVIATMALGEGARVQMEEHVRRLGSNLLSVSPGEQRQGSVRLGKESSVTLTMEDAEAIARECPAVDRVAPRVNGNGRVKYADQNTSTQVWGVTSDFFAIRNFGIAEGRAFLSDEMDRRERVCLLGPEVVKQLYGQHEPIGTRVYINGQSFRVIGVLTEKGGSDAWWDDRVWVPVTTAAARLFAKRYLSRIDLSAVDEASMDAAEEQIRRVLRRTHHLPDSRPDDFDIHNQEDVLETVNAQSQVLTMLLAGVASVSLLVGGIGIMNIMLVSVTERTREIGIRRAIGARRRDILVQFMIEALVMCGLGAVLGTAAGIGACWGGAAYAAWPIAITPTSILISSSFAVGIGLFFGLYPAARAAALSPLQALRHQ